MRVYIYVYFSSVDAEGLKIIRELRIDVRGFADIFSGRIYMAVFNCDWIFLRRICYT